MIDLLKSLADPCRLRLIAVLMRGEFTVQELTRMLNMGQSRISRHLKILTEAGVLTVKRQATWNYYRVGDANPLFNALLPALEQGLERLPSREEDLAALAGILEERRSRSQEFFDRYALQWDTLFQELMPTPNYLDRLLSAIPIDATTLEVGIGTGRLLHKLSCKSRRVIGVDNSPAMLEETRRRCASSGLNNVELRLGEMSCLPLGNASVDCVVANMVLHHATDPPTVLQELERVLVPGGLLLLADLARHEKEWVRERLADQWLGFGHNELLEWLKSAEFKAIKIETLIEPGKDSILLARSKKTKKII